MHGPNPTLYTSTSRVLRVEDTVLVTWSRCCTAPGSLDTSLLLSGGPHDGLVPRCPGIVRTAQAVLFDEPPGVVTGDEVADGVTDLVDGLVDSAMHDLLLQRAEE